MYLETRLVIVVILVTLLLCLLILHRWIRERIVQRQKTKAVRTSGKRALKPKSAADCPHCQAETGKLDSVCTHKQQVRPWSEMKSRRGRKKSIKTDGYACNNRACAYYHEKDAAIHALVGYGTHGKREKIQDLMCQACGKKFTVRRDTVLYQLKKHSDQVVLALTLMAEGVNLSTLERALHLDAGILQNWLKRAGFHAKKFHDVFFQELSFRHIQLDELWAIVRKKTQEVWLWVALDAETKVIPVMQLGPRTLEMAMGVVHELKQRMQAECKPIFISDGLKLYFYALTAHMGKWTQPEGNRKPVWEVAVDFVYAQVKKIHRRRRLVRIEYNMLCGEFENLSQALKAIGFTGKINTAFVERVNLTVRQSVAPLLRKTWSYAQLAQRLQLHLLWWRNYYHFARYHESLRVEFSSPQLGKGNYPPPRYRSRTPAMAAGLTDRRWSVRELISYPLPE